MDDSAGGGSGAGGDGSDPLSVNALTRVLRSRKGVYALLVVVMSLPIVGVLTWAAARGFVTWDVWSSRLVWIFGIATAPALGAIFGTSFEDSASKGAQTSVQVQGDHAIVNQQPSVRPPPNNLSTAPASMLPSHVTAPVVVIPRADPPWNEAADPFPLPSSVPSGTTTSSATSSEPKK